MMILKSGSCTINGTSFLVINDGGKVQLQLSRVEYTELKTITTELTAHEFLELRCLLMEMG